MVFAFFAAKFELSIFAKNLLELFILFTKKSIACNCTTP
jgi:hypothetical protein